MLKSRGKLNGPWSGDKPITITPTKKKITFLKQSWGGRECFVGH